MKINATQNTRASGPTRRKGADKSSVFSPAGGKAQGTGANTASASLTGASAISSVDALIALQESDDFRQARKKATARADDLLDILSALRLGLLEGRLSPGDLGRLQNTLRSARPDTGDIKLEALLNDVETRAQVEIAKLQSRH